MARIETPKRIRGTQDIFGDDQRRFARVPPAFSVGVDTNHCFDADNRPLEGKSTTPHVLVVYDLVAGRDTVLERAVAELKVATAPRQRGTRRRRRPSTCSISD